MNFLIINFKSIFYNNKLNKSDKFIFIICLVLNAVFVLSTASSIINNTDVHIISDGDFEERSYPYIHPGGEELTSRPTHTYYHDSGSEIVEFLCTGNANCIRLSSCRIMVQLLDKSCLLMHKLHDLTCGFTEGEPMVCCPNQNSVPSLPSRPSPPSQPVPKPTTLKPPVTTGNAADLACGLPHLHNWEANNYKGIGSQPWVVRVGFKNKVTGLLEHPCCGSIIGPRVILTAAHCALKKPETLSIVSVRVGEYDTSQNPDCTQTFCALPTKDVPLAHVVVHPGYSPKNYRHNIALLILKNRLNFSVTVQPICLHNSHAPLEGTVAKLVGWGKLPGDTEVRKRQQQLDLPVISLDNCLRVYGNYISLNNNEICVGGEEGKDACSGFGGAPLVLLQQYSRPVYSQIGIVSFGSEKCGVEGVPSVYVRVDMYVDWIKLNSPQET